MHMHAYISYSYYVHMYVYYVFINKYTFPVYLYKILNNIYYLNKNANITACEYVHKTCVITGFQDVNFKRERKKMKILIKKVI